MQAEVTLSEVRTIETRNGNVRYVATDDNGAEYTTFREDIGKRAKQLEGQRVRLEYHEETRGRFTNVYLDQIAPAGKPPEPEAELEAGSDADSAEAAAWRTAVEAAPWLVGEPESGKAVPPKKLYEQLKPFEERVASDIEEHGTDLPRGDADRVAGQETARGVPGERGRRWRAGQPAQLVVIAGKGTEMAGIAIRVNRDQLAVPARVACRGAPFPGAGHWR